MNLYSVRALYVSELARTWDDLVPSFIAPILSVSLYFIVFGSLHVSNVAGGSISYGSFAVPGLILLTVITDTVLTAGASIYRHKESGTVYEILAAPIFASEIIVGFVGSSLSKAMLLGLAMFATARLFVPYTILHPVWVVVFLVVISTIFSAFGLILGVWATGWRKLFSVSSMILAPLLFLSGGFYSIDSLSPFWKALTLTNPMVYIVSAFRWSFYGYSEVDLRYCLAGMLSSLLMLLFASAWIFTTGYKWRP
jgi:ABC-2 type transport system permease protein